MGDLARHVGPRFQPLRPLQLAALPLQVGRHLVEVVHQAPQFVARRRRDPRVEVAAGDPAGRARQPFDRIPHPLGHPVADRRAQEAEQHDRREDLAIELVDPLIDLLLTVR